MNNKFLQFLLLTCLISTCLFETTGADNRNRLGDEYDITGFWKSMDENTGLIAAIIGIYEYRDKRYGKLIITYNDGLVKDTIYNPGEQAEKLIGTPFFAGLDFIWDLELKGNKWINGCIMDPQEGKFYHGDLWMKDDELIVRGKIKIGFIFLGRNQIWLPVQSSDLPQGFILPDLSGTIPTRWQAVE
ncbi:MAG: DUF2147 domain-containing protein [Spirochaetales bacterium]|nr:DUF2147 domain-containing protein [Spirochaetales bacterium]